MNHIFILNIISKFTKGVDRHVGGWSNDTVNNKGFNLQYGGTKDQSKLKVSSICIKCMVKITTVLAV